MPGVAVPEPVEDLPKDVVSACKTLIAYCVNTKKDVLMVSLNGLTHEALRLGDFEVQVRKTD